MPKLDKVNIFDSQSKQPVFKCYFCDQLQSHISMRLMNIVGDKVSREVEQTSLVGNEYSDIIKTIRSKYSDPEKIGTITLCTCNNCGNNSLWVSYEDERLEQVSPHVFDYPQPHTDLPDNIKDVYNQAGKILNISSGASAALSRVSLELLLKHLGYTKNRLNDNIADVIASNLLSTTTMTSLDVIRHFGNEGAHTGTISLDDDNEVAKYLLESINDIVDDLITKPKNNELRYNSLPEGIKKAIERRDQNN